LTFDKNKPIFFSFLHLFSEPKPQSPQLLLIPNNVFFVLLCDLLNILRNAKSVQQSGHQKCLVVCVVTPFVIKKKKNWKKRKLIKNHTINKKNTKLDPTKQHYTTLFHFVLLAELTEIDLVTFFVCMYVYLLFLNKMIFT
jgi:hypothetical protein